MNTIPPAGTNPATRSAEMAPAEIRQAAGHVAGVSAVTVGSADSIEEFPNDTVLDSPSLSPDDAMTLLQGLMAKLGNESQKSATEGVRANSDKQKAAREEQQKKLLEAAESVGKAAKAGKLNEAFGWLGAGLAIAVALLTVFSLGTATVPAIVGVVGAMVGAALSMTSQVVNSIPGAMDAMGEDGAKAFMYTMLALQIAAAGVSLGGGIANGATKAGTVATEEGAKTVLSKVLTESQRATAQKLQFGTQIAEGVNEIGAGANQIAAGKFHYDADQSKADAAVVEKWLRMLQHQDQEAVEFVRSIQESVDNGWQVVASIVSDAADLQHTVVQQTSV
ncbi:MAG: type III secretion system translocon subunit SctE [Planctomycetaceae bacterium]|nr:type III secretion system translocon subunit SctE [Planctomycetaceae bacterium]